MEGDHFEAFKQIDISDEPGSEKNKHYTTKPYTIYKYTPNQKIPRSEPEPINFENYIQENCRNKITILNRETYNQIKRPRIIFFHHFREKCLHLTNCLDKIYQLALKFEDQIEFIAADMFDMDLIYPGTNPMKFFHRMVWPEREAPNIFAIDEKKRIHQHFDGFNTFENLLELCEDLIKGNLFPSLPIPKNNKSNLVKICVHDSYEELILKSTKNIFLIISPGPYNNYYDKVALALKKYNLDVIFMEAERNYIPFEYYVRPYPSLIYIPAKDKNNFIHYEFSVEWDVIIEFLKDCINQPEYLKCLQIIQKARKNYREAEILPNFSLDLKDLPAFLERNYDECFKILDRQILEKSENLNLIIFMDFREQFLAQNVEWLNKLYPAIEICKDFNVFIADFKQIDVISRKWRSEDLLQAAQGKPRIYGIDHYKNIYEFGNFESAPSFFYFTDNLLNGDLYYSEVCKRVMNNDALVKDWTADFKTSLKTLRKHIFVTFYSSDDENVEKLFSVLEQIARDVKELEVEVVKFDVKLNYLSVEYAQPKYPVHYFLPKRNKRDFKIYIDNSLSRDNMLEFIKTNVEQ